MAVRVPLQALPNQSLSLRLDGTRYDLAVQTVGTVMAVTIARDGLPLVAGARAVAGTPLLPYGWQAPAGNFVFVTPGDQMPWWEHFDDHPLLYLTAEEMAAP